MLNKATHSNWLQVLTMLASTLLAAYAVNEVNVLCVCLTKFELDQVQKIVDELDPRAFITEQEGLHVRGNFPRRLT